MAFEARFAPSPGLRGHGARNAVLIPYNITDVPGHQDFRINSTPPLELRCT
jgi:hypothetical protein